MTKQSTGDAVFRALRVLLLRHANGLKIAVDTPARFSLEATVGPATLAAWGGRTRRPTIPVAWVEHGKTYVSYHLMGLNGNSPLVEGLSPQLRARMQGKTCFNFRQHRADLFAELDGVTAESINQLRRGGYVTID